MLRSLTVIGSVLTTLLSASCVVSFPDSPRQEWGKDAADNLGLMLEELASPEVSGEELASTAKQFQRQWEGYLTQRGKMASALADLASLYEQRNRFSEALAIYESLWEHFPEQQELIGKIKRHRAFAEIPIDLSTPESAFLSLKRSLLTYKLTAHTFGIVDSSTILYSDSPPWELRDWQKGVRWLEKKVAEGHTDTGHPIDLKPDKSWPEATTHPWREVTRSLGWYRLKSVRFTKTNVLKALEKLAELSPVPIILSPRARSYLESLVADGTAENVLPSLKLDGVPLYRAFKLIMGEACSQDFADKYASRLRIEEGDFALHIYDTRGDKLEPFLTAVRQHEPGVPFPDDIKPASGEDREFSLEYTRRLLSDTFWSKNWLLHLDGCTSIEVIHAPRSVALLWSNIISIPELGIYLGRVLPLFRCLRAYPLPGPRADRYGDPKKRYIWMHQLDWQRNRISRFLSDRTDIVMLLGSKLVGFEQRSPNRFLPRLDQPPDILDIASRLGLWYDGKAYRFLLFDSEEDRERWLKGEDWHDIPSDLDDYEWPSEEEVEKKWKEAEKNAAEGVSAIPDFSDPQAVQ